MGVRQGGEGGGLNRWRACNWPNTTVESLYSTYPYPAHTHQISPKWWKIHHWKFSVVKAPDYHHPKVTRHKTSQIGKAPAPLPAEPAQNSLAEYFRPYLPLSKLSNSSLNPSRFIPKYLMNTHCAEQSSISLSLSHTKSHHESLVLTTENTRTHAMVNNIQILWA